MYTIMPVGDLLEKVGTSAPASPIHHDQNESGNGVITANRDGVHALTKIGRRAQCCPAVVTRRPRRRAQSSAQSIELRGKHGRPNQQVSFVSGRRRPCLDGDNYGNPSRRNWPKIVAARPIRRGRLGSAGRPKRAAGALISRPGTYYAPTPLRALCRPDRILTFLTR